jgi:hypothetical protein
LSVRIGAVVHVLVDAVRTLHPRACMHATALLLPLS